MCQPKHLNHLPNSVGKRTSHVAKTGHGEATRGYPELSGTVALLVGAAALVKWGGALIVTVPI